MNKIAKLTLSVFIILSSSSYADKILLRGKPIILIPSFDYYQFPNGYTPNQHYHFVDLSGAPKICFLSFQPQLNSLDLMRINILQNNKKFLWYCYRYDRRYFTIDY